jgi:N-acylneuraminate cytidylyltransferase
MSAPPLKVLALIPARGGSKGIPRKNIKLLGDRPVIAYAIAAARAATLVNRVVCTTDDEEIAGVARHWGAEVPFLRPSELAQDDTEDWPVFHHAVQWLEEHEGWSPDVVVNVRPTSPFRTAEHIDGAVRLLIESGADSVKSISLARQHPHKMWRKPSADGLMEPFLDTEIRRLRGPDVPRAQLEDVYWQNGLVDATRRSVIFDLGVMIGPRAAGLITGAEDAVDLDSPLDFTIAEALLAQRIAKAT